MSKRKIVKNAICLFCSHAFRGKRELNYHFRTIHFYCKECDVEEENKEQILKHLKDVHDSVPKTQKKIPTTCPICKFVLKDKFHLKVHLRLVHFYCATKECNEEFGSKDELLSHLQAEHPNESISDMVKDKLCKFCSAKYRDNGTLRIHYRGVHLYCDFCDKTLEDRDHILEHLKEVHNFNISCPDCNKSFLTNHSMNSHKKIIHLKESNFKCEICGYNTYSSGNLQQHVDVKHLNQGKVHQCNECEFETSWSQALKRHKAKMHNFIIAQIYNCDKCDYSTKIKGNLKTHKNTHNIDSIGKYACELCDFSTSRKEYLKRHEEIHEERKMKECSICFKKVLHMDKHIQFIHKEVLMKKCDICDFSTKRNCDLKKHKLKHGSTRNIICDICDRKFSNTMIYKNHLRLVHEMCESGSQCNECGKMLNSLATLKIHRNTKDSDKFKCNICGWKGSGGREFESHMRKHLPMEHYLKCRKCSFVTHSSRWLMKHSRKSHEEKIPCDVCRFQAISMDELRNHRKLKHSNRNCEYCDYTNDNSKEMRYHTRKCMVSKVRYQCLYCHKKYHTKIGRTEHTKREHLKGKKLDLKIAVVKLVDIFKTIN